MPSHDDTLPWPHLLAGSGTTVRAGGVGGVLKTSDNKLSVHHVIYLYLPEHSECLCSCNCSWDDDCQTDPLQHHCCSWNYENFHGNKNGIEELLSLYDDVMCTCVSVCGAGRGCCSGKGAAASPHSWIQGQSPWREKIIFSDCPMIKLNERQG